MLDILEPFTCIAWPILMDINSFPMSFVVFPISFVDITVSMDESASSVGFVIDPVPFIEREIFPDLFSSTVSHTVAELSDVLGSVFESEGAFGDKRLWELIVIFEGT